MNDFSAIFPRFFRDFSAISRLVANQRKLFFFWLKVVFNFRNANSTYMLHNIKANYLSPRRCADCAVTYGIAQLDVIYKFAIEQIQF